MERETALAFHDRFGYLQPRMVIEITEAEDLNLDATREKRDNPGSSGMFALDDYGSGYNSEKTFWICLRSLSRWTFPLSAGLTTTPTSRSW